MLTPALADEPTVREPRGTTIAVLSPRLASQIAAGEVVERPASAAKELIENAIDAGATRCDIEVDGGGITRLSVADDGRGMSREDARLSIERHATSKLAVVEDLGRITTYGFRGEALPSIASVTRFSLRTRRAGDEAGTQVDVEGGGTPSMRPAGVPVGTTVELRDLFFNVVARRKFLRSAGTEAGHVTDVVESAALARPDLTFTLVRDGRRVRELLRVEGREERVRALLGEGLAACSGQRGPLAVEAFLSRPEHARSGAGGLHLLVNGRPVKDRALLYSIAQAYGSVLERGRYPRGVVYLDLPPSLVDVNVHPQKSEVRFADPRAVGDALYQVLSSALSRAFSLPSPSRTGWFRGTPSGGAASGGAASGGAASGGAASGGAASGGAASGGAASTGLAGDAAATITMSSTPSLANGADPGAVGSAQHGVHPGDSTIGPSDVERAWGFAPVTAGDAFSGEAGTGQGGEPFATESSTQVLAASDSASPIAPSPAVRWASLRFIAQVRQTYLVCEGHEGLYVIDQHAAAERVNFDKLRKQYRSRTVPSQTLLFPLTLQVAPAEAEVAEALAEDFAALGIQVCSRGPEMVSVHSVPKLLTRASPERIVRDLLTEAARTGRRAFSDAVDLALATMACHGSVRAGDPLSQGEATALLASLDSADFAGHCPHGRAIVAFTSWNELERKVGRR